MSLTAPVIPSPQPVVETELPEIVREQFSYQVPRLMAFEVSLASPRMVRIFRPPVWTMSQRLVALNDEVERGSTRSGVSALAFMKSNVSKSNAPPLPVVGRLRETPTRESSAIRKPSPTLAVKATVAFNSAMSLPSAAPVDVTENSEAVPTRAVPALLKTPVSSAT